ncbi:MAG: hypothetical protein AB7O98_08865 [Hyphomonadaceae bacterium]
MCEGEHPVLTPQELIAAGQALYGGGWRSELACALGVSEQHMALVEAGKLTAPVEWRGKLVVLAQDVAMRALDTASSPLWRVTGNQHDIEDFEPAQPRYA